MNIEKLEKDLVKKWAMLPMKGLSLKGNPGDYKVRLGWWDKNMVDETFNLTKQYEDAAGEGATKNLILWNRGICAWELGRFETAQSDFEKLASINCSMQKMAEKNLKKVKAKKPQF